MDILQTIFLAVLNNYTERWDKMNYKKLIIEMVGKIKDEKFLKRIYISLREYLKESEEV